MTTTLSLFAAVAIAVSLWLYRKRRARLRQRAQFEAAAQEWEQREKELLRQYDEFREEVARNRRHREALRKQQQEQQPQQATSLPAASKAPKTRKPRLRPVASASLAEENDGFDTCIDAHLAVDPQTFAPELLIPQREPRVPRRSVFNYSFRPLHFTLRCISAALAPVIHLSRWVANFFNRPKPPPPSTNVFDRFHRAA